MPCDFPNPAYRTGELGSGGRRLITFNPKRAIHTGSPIWLPCGRCVGCRMDQARQWAARIDHERQLHPFNCFLTLTYSDEHVPQDYSLNKRDPVLFIKRLRKHAAYHHKGLQLRYYLAAEYGDLRGRPHYHAAIFGYDFPDKKLYKNNRDGQPIYVSEILSKLWFQGDAKTANLDYGSAAYIARYCTKKRIGPKAADYYYRLSPVDGQMHFVQSEFALMSNKPGIGADWANKFHADWMNDGFIHTGGHFQPIPRYYEKFVPEKLKARWKRDRIRKKFENIERYRNERTDARRYVRAEVRNARIANLKRTSSGE